MKIWRVNVARRQQEGQTLVDNLLQGQIRRTSSEFLGQEEGPGGLRGLSGDRGGSLQPAHEHRLGSWSSPEVPNARSPPHSVGSASGRRGCCPGYRQEPEIYHREGGGEGRGTATSPGRHQCAAATQV